MADLFSKVARAWKAEGVDEWDITIELGFKDKRFVDLDRHEESRLVPLFHEIKHHPCWEAVRSGSCCIDVKICLKWSR